METEPKPINSPWGDEEPKDKTIGESVGESTAKSTVVEVKSPEVPPFVSQQDKMVAEGFCCGECRFFVLRTPTDKEGSCFFDPPRILTSHGRSIRCFRPITDKRGFCSNFEING